MILPGLGQSLELSLTNSVGLARTEKTYGLKRLKEDYQKTDVSRLYRKVKQDKTELSGEEWSVAD